MNKKIKATTPYIYAIGWQHDDLSKDAYYVGMRHAVGCDPSDLWVKYFTSSERVKRYRKECGEPNFIMILETFETCYDRETKDRVALRDVPNVRQNGSRRSRFAMTGCISMPAMAMVASVFMTN